MKEVHRVRYDPETGEFTWAIGGRGVKAGSRIGCVTRHGYRVGNIGRKQYRLHRLAWFIVHGRWPEGEIDHINGDPLDNRICNLREATRAENSQNRRRAHADSSHGFLGASWNVQHGRWQSKIVANKVRHHLGYFDTAEAAHVAYMDAKGRLHIAGAGD